MDLQELGCGNIEWLELGLDRDSWLALVKVVLKIRVPQNAGYFFTNTKGLAYKEGIFSME